MSLIEGIGDEVTFLVAVIAVVLVMAVAWMSTRVDAAPYTSIVIIDRDRFVDLLRRLRGLSSSSTTNAVHGPVPASVAASVVSSADAASVVSNADLIANENQVDPSNSETVVDSRPQESVANQEISSTANVATSSLESLAAAPVPDKVESALLSNISASTSQQSQDQPSSSASDLSANDIASNKIRYSKYAA